MTISLHTHSAYSLLDGASNPYELIKRGSELGYKTIALTDHDSVSGVFEFQRLALEAGIKPIVGCEVTLADQSHLTLLAENYLGYQKICCYLNNPVKTLATLPFGEGLLVLSGCRHSKLQKLLLKKRYQEALELAQSWSSLFKGRFFIEMSHDRLPKTQQLLTTLSELAQKLKLPMVATVDVHYAYPEDFPVHDSLNCIRLGIGLNDVHPERSFNNASYLCSREELDDRFKDFPKALEGAYFLAEIPELKPLTPPKLLPEVPKAKQKLTSLALEGFDRKYPLGNESAKKRLAYELDVISTLGYAGYFLLVHDLISFAKSQEITYQGRGSAAGSLVSYCLDLTQVDPIAHNLVFERFLSLERSNQPDIDIDFDWQRRLELREFLENKYGSEHIASICAFHRYREDLARNDLLRIGLPENLLPVLVDKMYGLPRHIATHSSGLAIASKDLARHVPLVKTSLGQTIIAFDKDDIEEMGLVKLDLLSLRTLGALSELNLPVQENDEPTYKMLASGKSLGVFQLESPAQRGLQQRIKPHNFNDLVASVALIRPGPIKGNMVEPFIKRHLQKEEVSYLTPEVKPYLEKTYGLIVFQEQILQIATVLAGFTLGESDKLRKALTSKKRESELKQFRHIFLEKAQQRGASLETASSVFDTLESFAGYGLCEAHSASFAQTAYKTAYLRCHYPAEFFAALINNQPLGYYPPQSLLWEAKRLGVKIIPLDINTSPLMTKGCDGQIFLGLKLIKGFSEKTFDEILKRRPFNSWRDLEFVSEKERRLLIFSGALDSFAQSRRSLLWELWGSKPLPGDFSPWDRFLREMLVLNLSPFYHVMDFYRQSLPASVLKASETLAAEGPISFAGQILKPHRPPTKSGRPVVFFVMEDETGQVDVTYFPRQNQLTIKEGGIALVFGSLDRKRAPNLLLENISYLGSPANSR